MPGIPPQDPRIPDTGGRLKNMPDSEGMFDMDAIRTFAVSSAANPSGSDVARMLRVAADHMATEVGPIESIMAELR